MWNMSHTAPPGLLINLQDTVHNRMSSGWLTVVYLLLLTGVYLLLLTVVFCGAGVTAVNCSYQALERGQVI